MSFSKFSPHDGAPCLVASNLSTALGYRHFHANLQKSFKSRQNIHKSSPSGWWRRDGDEERSCTINFMGFSTFNGFQMQGKWGGSCLIFTQEKAEEKSSWMRLEVEWTTQHKSKNNREKIWNYWNDSETKSQFSSETRRMRMNKYLPISLHSLSLLCVWKRLAKAQVEWKYSK